MKKKALVAGALGVIGRSLIQELEKQKDWEIVGISRRVPEKKDKTKYGWVEDPTRPEVVWFCL